MKPTDSYVYYENTYENLLNGYKRNNDNLMWRYWAAKEMAKDIIDSLQFDDIKYIKFIGTGTPYNISNGLIQLLKKEWFR